MRYIVGLGNPGEEYANTRHNTGRIVVEDFKKKFNFPEWEKDKLLKALVSKGGVEKEKVTLLLPDAFMNKSGLSLKPLVTNVKKAHDLVVVYDDLDLPLGSYKISFNRGAGGHRGLESVVKNIKTKEFVRIRVGISPVTPSGKLKKPSGDREVEKHILGDFKPAEREVLKKLSKKLVEAMEAVIVEGREVAMNRFN